MALGPSSVHPSRIVDDLSIAEMVIDEAIRVSDGPRVVIESGMPRLSPDDWNEVLRPKYLAAGWKRVDWGYNQIDGTYIILDA